MTIRDMAAAAAIVVVASCGGARDAATPEFSVQDSAGIRVVHNAGPGTLDAAVLDSPRMTLKIGEQDGAPEVQFFRIWDVDQTDGGEIHVVDAGNAEVRVFDGDGRFVRRYGRRGRGPGEFAFPQGVFLRGDTSIVTDGQLARLTMFDAEGHAIETIPIGGARGTRLYPFAAFDGGWTVMPVMSRGWPYRDGVMRRDTTRIVSVVSLAAAFEGAASIPADTLGHLPADVPGWRTVVEFEGSRTYGVQTPMTMTAASPLFEPTPRYAVDGAGNVHLATGYAYVIDTYAPDGVHIRRLTRTASAVPVTESMVSAFESKAKAYWDTASTAGEAILGKANDEKRSTLPHVDILPPTGRIYASAAGSLWVERPDLVADPVALAWTRGGVEPYATKWDLFDPGGRFQGQVTLPPKFTPRQVGERWILGIWRDDLDVQYVVRFSIGD